ncbi:MULTISPECIES: hypothetical protein [unclassified Nostoc]|uniref:hypothetical protein n=1 Tax=unclassified Nostoc TaxID=2593658 RepID=UPI002AD31484|nr:MULTISPECIES: hypothetical protein [unclassified Nostoc]MDZ8122890.1 hypothetical protein [Nostoc sp. CmiVER01]MDZ8224091.1 hypothetical protein [Nostoc sp. ChiVER01]
MKYSLFNSNIPQQARQKIQEIQNIFFLYLLQMSAKMSLKSLQKIKQLCQQHFACEKDVLLAAERLNRNLPLHQLVDIKVLEVVQHQKRGRPRKDAQLAKHYLLCATITSKQTAIDIEVQNLDSTVQYKTALDESWSSF